MGILDRKAAWSMLSTEMCSTGKSTNLRIQNDLYPNLVPYMKILGNSLWASIKEWYLAQCY